MIDFRVLIEQDSEISVREQCELLEISRSSFYYNAKGENPEKSGSDETDGSPHHAGTHCRSDNNETDAERKRN